MTKKKLDKKNYLTLFIFLIGVVFLVGVIIFAQYSTNTKISTQPKAEAPQSKSFSDYFTVENLAGMRASMNILNNHLTLMNQYAYAVCSKKKEYKIENSKLVAEKSSYSQMFYYSKEYCWKIIYYQNVDDTIEVSFPGYPAKVLDITVAGLSLKPFFKVNDSLKKYTNNSTTEFSKNKDYMICIKKDLPKGDTSDTSFHSKIKIIPGNIVVKDSCFKFNTRKAGKFIIDGTLTQGTKNMTSFPIKITVIVK